MSGPNIGPHRRPGQPTPIRWWPDWIPTTDSPTSSRMSHGSSQDGGRLLTPGRPEGVQNLRNVRLKALQVTHNDLTVLRRQSREGRWIPRVLCPPDGVPKTLRDRLGHVVRWSIVHRSTLSATGPWCSENHLGVHSGLAMVSRGPVALPDRVIKAGLSNEGLEVRSPVVAAEFWRTFAVGQGADTVGRDTRGLTPGRRSTAASPSS